MSNFLVQAIFLHFFSVSQFRKTVWYISKSCDFNYKRGNFDYFLGHFKEVLINFVYWKHCQGFLI